MINKTEKYTDREWEELASQLSDEKSEKTDLLDNFLANDKHDSGKQWKELRDLGGEKDINVDKAWNKLYSKLNENEFQTVKSHIRFSFTINSIMRAAAVALIIISLGLTAVYINNPGAFSKKIIFQTGNDQKNLLVSLPDGSKIFLNRNSELRYRTNFGKHTRTVNLSGEAFFEISADRSKPFIIDAGKARVKVVGTTFNVITNNSESAVEVYVKTGKVLLSDNTGTQSVLLDPGFVGTVDSEKSEKAINKDPNYLSWKTGLLVYNGQKLDIVFKDLKRVYNMDIVADDPAILGNPWNITIDNQSQEIIINLICASFILSYTKDGSVYHLSKK